MAADPLQPDPSPNMLRLLVCPVCRQPLALEDGAARCSGCSRRYPILDGIPVLLADRAG